MQPYTPHGDSNNAAEMSRAQQQAMQPYTPHGDSNVLVADQRRGGKTMQPYTPHGDSNSYSTSGTTTIERGCNLIPLTGTVTRPTGTTSGRRNWMMQPYTPHGDSNC